MLDESFLSNIISSYYKYNLLLTHRFMSDIKIWNEDKNAREDSSRTNRAETSAFQVKGNILVT